MPPHQPSQTLAPSTVLTCAPSLLTAPCCCTGALQLALAQEREGTRGCSSAMDGAPEAAPRYRVVSSHSGADFEAGRLGHRNGEAPNDGAEHEVVNAHEPEPVAEPTL